MGSPNAPLVTAVKWRALVYLDLLSHLGGSSYVLTLVSGGRCHFCFVRTLLWMLLCFSCVTMKTENDPSCSKVQFVFWLQFAFGVPDLTLKDIACSKTLLNRFIIFSSPKSFQAVHSTMCALSQEKLQRVEDSLYANADFFKIFHLVSIAKDSLCYRYCGDLKKSFCC